MILVTGATGNIGRALLTSLTGPVRGLTRDPAGASFPAGVEAVEGDLADAVSLEPALDGVRSLFLVSGMGDADVEIVDLARRSGVEHVVLVSSITVETHPHLPAAKEKAALEQELRDSGMAWTMLRPGQFASNTLWWAESIHTDGWVRLPYPDVGLPTIHPADIAAVARVALTSPGHRGQAYALTGPARVTAREQVAAVAAALGMAVGVEEISRAEAHREMAEYMDDEVAAAVLDLMGGDVNDALLEVRDTVPRITGEPGRPFQLWVTENVAAFRSGA
jgi:uncharacterized protein YbjT (DUF2867 family)